MEKYAIYLRKSRKDEVAEQQGEEETMARHERALFDLAGRQGLNVAKVFKELVSGDTIEARPQMQKLLREVERGMWAGVLVMEVERLARGDTKDQGRIAQAFKYSETLIITPHKTFDPSNEFDEEYFEFGLFMSRRELKTITRRMQRGRADSVKEGKYVAAGAPYGYNRVKLAREKGFTLVPHPEQADVVRLIFQWYTFGLGECMGTTQIARKLNKMKIPPQKGEVWAASTIRDILINPVYIGLVRWNWRPNKKKMLDGEAKRERPRAKEGEYMLQKGLHEGIVEPKIFDTARELMSKKRVRPISENLAAKNPWAGLIICGKCGKKMVRRPYGKKGCPDTLICQNINCDNISSRLAVVEARILEVLWDWLGGYKLIWPQGRERNEQQIVEQRTLAKADREIEVLEKQIGRVHDLLEQGTYSVELFLERSRRLTEHLRRTKENRENLSKKIGQKEQQRAIPNIDKIWEVFSKLPDAAAKNDLLKEVVEKVVYIKNTKGSRAKPSDNFEIVVYPRLPLLRL